MQKYAKVAVGYVRCWARIEDRVQAFRRQRRWTRPICCASRVAAATSFQRDSAKSRFRPDLALDYAG